MDAPEIANDAELLALLREAPAVRAVAYPDNKNPAVCECRDGDPGRPHRVLARVSDTGSARKLLTHCQDADIEGDVAAWAALPLRYGPYCSTWVLPEHPRAPSKPGVDE